MAVITITGLPGSRADEIARLTAQRLKLELVSESTIRRLVAEEFGSETAIPRKILHHAITYVLARLAREHHLSVSAPGAELLVHRFPGFLRTAIHATEKFRTGTLMLDHRLERPAARDLLRRLDHEHKSALQAHYGRAAIRPESYDLAVNAGSLEPDQIVDLIEGAAYGRGLLTQGLVSAQMEAELQFHARLEFSRRGIHPAGKASLARNPFAHPSEEVFATLLDFYRIPWEYEPRSFPVQWDNNGTPVEYFTPDFYLPEFDLYVELTTMKQAHVTRKNRKVKLLRSIYPHVNIRIFYQKDFQDLIFKHGLSEQVITA